MSNFFTLYWRHNSTNIIRGETAEEAITSAGFSHAARAIDFWMPGIDTSYKRNKEKHEWVKKEPIHIHIDDAQKSGNEFVTQFIKENIDDASEIIFDCEGGHQFLIEKKASHFYTGWATVISICFGEHHRGSYDGSSEEDHHYMISSTEYEDPDNLDRAIERVILRLKEPYKVSGIQSVDLAELSKKQGFSGF